MRVQKCHPWLQCTKVQVTIDDRPYTKSVGLKYKYFSINITVTQIANQDLHRLIKEPMCISSRVLHESAQCKEY